MYYYNIRCFVSFAGSTWQLGQRFKYSGVRGDMLIVTVHWYIFYRILGVLKLSFEISSRIVFTRRVTVSEAWRSWKSCWTFLGVFSSLLVQSGFTTLRLGLNFSMTIEAMFTLSCCDMQCSKSHVRVLPARVKTREIHSQRRENMHAATSRYTENHDA